MTSHLVFRGLFSIFIDFLAFDDLSFKDVGI